MSRISCLFSPSPKAGLSGEERPETLTKVPNFVQSRLNDVVCKRSGEGENVQNERRNNPLSNCEVYTLFAAATLRADTFILHSWSVHTWSWYTLPVVKCFLCTSTDCFNSVVSLWFACKQDDALSSFCQTVFSVQRKYLRDAIGSFCCIWDALITFYSGINSANCFVMARRWK